MKKFIASIFLVSTILYLLPVTADLPMPSNVELIGCMNESNMIVVSHEGNGNLHHYPWIGNLKEYSINPCSVAPTERPFIPIEYSGKMLKINASLNIRDDVIVCPDTIHDLGPCLPVILYGCILDGLFLCSDYSYGNVPRYTGEIKSDSRVIPILTQFGDKINLSPYNGKQIVISAMNLKFSNGSLNLIYSNESLIEVNGDIPKPLPIFISRPLTQQQPEKSNNENNDVKPETESQGIFQNLINYLFL